MGAYPRQREKWVNGKPVTAAELDAIDGQLATMMNGDGGGTFTVSEAAINLRGAPLYLLGPSTISNTAKVTTPFGAGVAIVLNDGDYPLLANAHTSATIDRDQNVLDATCVRPQVIANGTSLETLYPGARFSLPLRVHDGALLTRVVLTFRVQGAHGGGTPDVMPKVRLVAIGPDGVLVPMKTVADGADPKGWVYMARPASGALWHDSGNAKTFTYTTSSSLNAIHRATTRYRLDVVDESGTNAFTAGAANGNLWQGVVTRFDSITDTRLE